MRNTNITITQNIVNKVNHKTDFTILLNDTKNRYVVSCKNLYTGFNPSLKYDLNKDITNVINTKMYDSVGGWFDKDKKVYYLDANLHFSILKYALICAKNNGQIAIYDTLKQQVIYLNNN